MDLQGDQRPKEFFGRVEIGEDIVVHKENNLPALSGFDLPHHFLGQAGVVAFVKVAAHHAESAGETAAPAELHQRNGQIALACENIPPGKDTRWATPTGAS